MSTGRPEFLSGRRYWGGRLNPLKELVLGGRQGLIYKKKKVTQKKLEWRYQKGREEKEIMQRGCQSEEREDKTWNGLLPQWRGDCMVKEKNLS